VTPAMGASTVAGATKTEPRRTSAGTLATAGMACSLGLSQSLFTVKPLPAIEFLSPDQLGNSVTSYTNGLPREPGSHPAAIAC
jgi:hypothetical protein